MLGAWYGTAEFHSTASRLVDGAMSRISSKRFVSSCGEMSVKPVRLRPGRAKVVTSPLPTGSLTTIITIGVVAVAVCRASAAGVPAATSTSGRPAAACVASSG